MIDYLRSRGLRLGVVSNCFAEDVAAWPHCSLAKRFDCTVFSFEVGVAKPDPEIYREATRRLGVDVSETCFIGDGGHEELWGAEQAGLRAFKALWFLRRWPHLPDEPPSASRLGTVEEAISLVEGSIGGTAFVYVDQRYPGRTPLTDCHGEGLVTEGRGSTRIKK